MILTIGYLLVGLVVSYFAYYFSAKHDIKKQRVKNIKFSHEDILVCLLTIGFWPIIVVSCIFYFGFKYLVTTAYRAAGVKK